MRARIGAFVVILTLVAWLPPAAAQQVPASDTSTPPLAPVQPKRADGTRPRVGLALGGGSARGLAHIGVLEWFEQHRIPIDYIAGTSMGGLVAGAYATGMTPAEIREWIRGIDWDLMFLADSPFKYKTFRRKQDKRAYPSLLEFGLKHGFTLPSGLNPGQQVTFLLDHLALPYYDLQSFDDLPTPYRCVATDLKSSKAIVLGKGPLSQAMRATMAIPGVFTPVSLESWLLVDGGALDNVPGGVVRQMGADVVIVVNVAADDATDAETQQSLFSLLGRTIDAMMTGSVREALKNADVVIDPDLKGLTSMDWRRSDALADRGKGGAEAVRDKLLPYQMDEANYTAFMAARSARIRRTVPLPTFIDVKGGTPDQQDAISKALLDDLGKPFDEDRVQKHLLEVAGTDQYEFISYRPVQRPGGESGLLIGARPKSYGPPFLAVGLDLSNVDSTAFSVNLRGRITAYNVLTPRSELRLDLALGTQQVAATEMVFPIGRRGLFVSPRAYFSRVPRNAFDDDRIVGEYRIKRTGAGLDLGWTFTRRTELRVGYDAADVRGRVRVGSPGLPEVQGGENAARLLFTFDDQSSPVIPTRGLYLRTDVRRYFHAAEVVGVSNVLSPDQFWRGDVVASWFRRIRHEDRLFLAGGAGTAFGDRPIVNDFDLGGPLRLGAFDNDELHGSKYVLIDSGYLKHMGRLPDVLGGNIFVGGWLENGTAYDRWSTADWHTNVSVGVIAESLIGPIFVGGSLGPHGQGRIYVSVGPLFR